MLFFPNFMIIGAQKCATTWLATRLTKHPDVWMPSGGRSEIHYFNGYMLHLPLNWYSLLFEDARRNGKIAGEKTPDYGLLSERNISMIRDLMPELKVILLLRRPDERSWSHARMYVSIKDKAQSLSAFQVNRLIMQAGKLRNIERTNYLQMLNRWSKFFPPEQILVGFMDEIADDPDGLLKRACRFVGADSRYDLGEEAKKRIFASPELDMPDAARWYLQRKYRSMIVELAKRYPGQVKGWLEPDPDTINISLMEKVKTLFLTQVLTIPENMAYLIYRFIKHFRLERRIKVYKKRLEHDDW